MVKRPISKLKSRQNPIDRSRLDQTLSNIHEMLDSYQNQGFINSSEKRKILEKSDNIYDKTFNFLDSKIGGDFAGKCAVIAKIGFLKNQIRELE